MIMKATLSGVSNLNKTKKETLTPLSDTSSQDQDLHFAFFSTDDHEINAGIGFNIDPTHNFAPNKTEALIEPHVEQMEPEHESQEEVTPTDAIAESAQTVPAAELEEQPKSDLNIFTDEETDPEPIQSDIDKYKEKSGKIVADMISAMNTRRINADIPIPKVEHQGSLVIEVDVEAAPLALNIEVLEEAYKDQSTPVKETIVDVDKVTAADRAGKAVNYTTQTFIVAPVNGLFKLFKQGLFSLFSFLGDVIKFLLIAIVLTTIASVWYVYRIDPSMPVTEIPLQTYTVIKDITVATYQDVSDLVRGILGK